MTQQFKFKCKGPQCEKEVVFKHDIIIALRAMTSKSEKDIDEDEIMYLTCANGHTHPYAFSERIK